MVAQTFQQRLGAMQAPPPAAEPGFDWQKMIAGILQSITGQNITPPGPQFTGPENLLRGGARGFLGADGGVPGVAAPPGMAPIINKGLDWLDGPTGKSVVDWLTVPEGERGAGVQATPPGPAFPQLTLGGGSPDASASPPAPAPGDPRQLVYDALLGAGANPAQASGLVGRFIQESNLNPTIWGDNGTAYGLAQWRGDRLTGLNQWAESQGLDPNSLEVQAQYAWHELMNSPGEATARDAMLAAQTPEAAAEAAMHFERPKGYTTGSPRSGHGWNATLAQANDVFNALSGLPPVPPTVQAPQVPLPPEIAAPPGAPMPVGPDFSAADQWLDKAAPQAVPDSRAAAVMQVLAGLGAGIASGDGWMDALAKGGAGAASGAAQSLASRDARKREDAKAQQQYAGMRAGVAGTRAGQQADLQNTTAQTQYQNELGQYEVANANAQNRYKAESANALAQQEADATNADRTYQWQQDVWGAQRPKVLSATADGVVVQKGDQIEVLPLNSVNQQIEQQIEMIKALGEDSAVADELKYQTLEGSGNVFAYKNQIIRDVIKGGSGPVLFGEAYAQALEEAQSNVPPALASDPDAYRQAIDGYVASQLLAAIEAKGDDGWIAAAAQLGNIGAAKLLQLNKDKLGAVGQ